MELIPAIDLRGGRVVRLAQGDDGRRTVYGDDPAELLAAFAAAGVRLAHLVDLDAAFGEAPQRTLVAGLLRRVAGASEMGVQLGGGLRDAEAVAWALGAGCRRVLVGSLAVRRPDLLAELARQFSGRVVPALDARGGEVRVAGWREAGGFSAEQAARRLRGLPCPAVLVTDIERDGTLAGPNLELARRVAEASGLPALVSGGVRSLDDLRAARRSPEIAGVVVGKALLEGAFTLAQALAACRGEEAA